MKDSIEQNSANSSQNRSNDEAVQRWIPTEEDKKEFRDSCLEGAKQNFANINDLEQDFAKRLEFFQKHKDEKGHPTIMPLKEFEKWEEEAKQYYDSAVNSYEVIGLVSNKPEDMPEVASLMRCMYNTGTGETTTINDGVTSYNMTEYNSVIDNSIEAYSGHYYKERYNALLDAVRASDDPDKLNDEHAMTEFISAATRHLRTKNENYESTQTPQQILNDGDYRTYAHNEAIRSLNNLNRLARKYGTHAFTFRDFWTSGLPADVLPRTLAVRTKMRFDRDLVESYYANIDTMKDREKQIKRGNKVRERLFR